VRLTALPAPDLLEFGLPESHICLIADEGTPAGVGLARRLMACGWRVVTLRLPGAAATPDDRQITIVALDDWSEAALADCLAALKRDHGPVAGLIHLQPAGNGEWFGPREKASLKWLFLAAKRLKGPLNEAAERGHSFFVSVTRLDGQLGLGQGSNYAAVNGGVMGLTKTLNLEWPQVFCRVVDLSPTMAPGGAIEAIMAELHDPNRLVVEAGWNEQGRFTLSA